MLVNKPDGSLRMCIDYRKLNDISLSDAYPIPRISDILEKIGHSKYLSRFDLTKGYWQVPLSEDTKEKSAFITPYGLYEFNVMPFGMKTSPATFIRLMEKVLKGVNHVVSYFDDIVVYSDTWEEHLNHVEIVIKKIMDAKLTIRPSKCKLAADQIVCLGHVVGNGVIQPDPTKIRAMSEYPLPVTKKGMKSFLGLTGYYRQYIQNYAAISSALTDMLRKDRPTKLVWDAKSTGAFQSLKRELTSAPVLVTPDFTKVFRRTD